MTWVVLSLNNVSWFYLDFVIGLDSAGLHLASAIKNDYASCEVIGIYGPTSPYRSGPYGSIQNCLYLADLECIACRKKKCPLGHHRCMGDITPEQVYRVLRSQFVSLKN